MLSIATAPASQEDYVGAGTWLLFPPIVYPIEILAGSTNIPASIYVQYLRSPNGHSGFRKTGFEGTPLDMVRSGE
jgi:ABC-type molybdate transport system substrate-binding protein